VANILKRHGIEPAPERGRRTSWSTFLKAHWTIAQTSHLRVRRSLSRREKPPGVTQPLDRARGVCRFNSWPGRVPRTPRRDASLLPPAAGVDIPRLAFINPTHCSVLVYGPYAVVRGAVDLERLRRVVEGAGFEVV
jgi:hypothetical protein